MGTLNLEPLAKAAITNCSDFGLQATQAFIHYRYSIGGLMIRSKLTQVLMVTAFSMPAVSLIAVQPASANGNNYGAIAYSSATGSHGYSLDYSTGQAAKNAALRYCENYSGTGDCQSLVVFKNGCGALAQTPNNSAGSGWGGNRSTAESFALQSCSQFGPNCKITRWVCTSR